MLHSAHLAAKSLTGNGLAVAEAHSLGASDLEILAILWLLGVAELSRPLNEMSIHFGTSGRRTVIAEDFTSAGVRKVTEVARSVATPHLVDRVAEAGGLPVFETPVGFKFIGELINEDKIILGGEESAGLSIKGHYPKKDGIPSCLPAAKAVAARGESLTQQLNAPFAGGGKLESGTIGVRLTPEIMTALKERLAEDPTAISGRLIARTNRLDGVKFILEMAPGC
jgi:phosphomannomutase